MSTGENKCIKYLMKEMDPSEELEFEHLMRGDENLLIEVESLRVTHKKLSQLPLKNPPEQLSQKIIYDAKQLRSSRLNRTKDLKQFLAKGLAAAVVVSALSGGYFYYNQSIEPNTQAEAQPKSVSPWVDRNEVISLPQLNTSTSPADLNQAWNNEVQRSYEKLQLVKFYNSGNGAYPGFHLTGTSE